MNMTDYNDHRFDLLMQKVMPAPVLVFENQAYGYWNEWRPQANEVERLFSSLSSNSIIKFVDQRYGRTQYASFIRYNRHTLEVQLLDDQLQPLEAIASLEYRSETEKWVMTITTSILYVNSETNMENLSLDTLQIQDGVLGQYKAPDK